MLLTIKEAETKICLRMIHKTILEEDDAPMFLRCQTAQCMAWQFSDASMDFGFCGLAGVPLELDLEEEDVDA